MTIIGKMDASISVPLNPEYFGLGPEWKLIYHKGDTLFGFDSFGLKTYDSKGNAYGAYFYVDPAIAHHSYVNYQDIVKDGVMNLKKKIEAKMAEYKLEDGVESKEEFTINANGTTFGIDVSHWKAPPLPRDIDKFDYLLKEET